MLQKHEMAPAQQVVSAVQAAAGVPGLAEPCSADAALQMVPENLPVPHDSPQGRAMGGKGHRKRDGMGRRNRVGRDAGSKSRLRTGTRRGARVGAAYMWPPPPMTPSSKMASVKTRPTVT